jgi:hypothetical protein
MAAIERIKQHFAGIGVRHVESAAWGEEGKPLLIYFSPMTLAEKQRLLTIGEEQGYVARLADALIMKALDADGKKLFTIEDKHALRNQADPDELARIVREMMSSPSVDDMGKGSSRTPDSG